MIDGLAQRVVTAALLLPLALAAVLWAPTPLFGVLLAAVFLLGLWEWTRLVGLPTRPVRAVIVAAVALAIAMLWYAGSQRTLHAVVTLGVVWWLLAMLWLRAFRFGQVASPLNCALKTMAGSLMVIAAWSALVLLHGQPLGAWWTLYGLALVWAADISAYFAGRAFGRRKLAPSISPGKTWAGVWGALAGSALLAAIAGWSGFGLRDVAWLALIALTLVSVVFSIVGDLFESLIKRHSQCKDSGHLLPGHGGVFDRIDSILAAAPVFVFGKSLLEL